MEKHIDTNGNLVLGKLTFYQIDKDNDIEMNIKNDVGGAYKYLNHEEVGALIEFLQEQLSKIK